MNEPRGTNDDGVPEQWLPWTTAANEPSGFGLQTGGHDTYHPQPIITDIEFDGTNMLIGVRDRYGDQLGNLARNVANTSSPFTTGLGEIYRLCGTTGTSWTLESNGVCGGVTGSGAGNGQGPGGGEFYGQDGLNPVGGWHINLSGGGLANVRGTGVVVSTFNDSTGELHTGGMRWMNNTTGNRDRSVRFYQAAGGNGAFGKVNGVGDVEALLAAAPLEIGNRVWVDADDDGIQDPGEAGIDGVTIELRDAGNNVVATTITANGGQYLFAGVTPNTTYSVVIVNAVGAAAQAPLQGMAISKRDMGGDAVDSDALQNGVMAATTVTTGGPGANDHTIDFGFFRTYSLGNRVWIDANDNGRIDAGETGLSGATVELLDANGASIDPDGGGPLTQTLTTTNATGHYRFDNLVPGQYRVRATAPAGYASSTPDDTNPDSDVDATAAAASDNGVGTGSTATSGIVSIVGGEPTGETDLTAGANAQGTLDAQANMTVDFGFHLAYSLGNRVWNDPNDNSRIDAGETGISGATVELLTAAGASIDPDGAGPLTQTLTTTDANGYYRFDNLLAGSYRVRVTAPGGFVSSTTDEATGDADVDGGPDAPSDNGIGTGNTATSGVITLGPGEPTGETDLVGGANPQGGPDNQANMTVDFGFRAPPVPLYSVGNRVWNDPNDNSRIDAGETGLAGATVELLTAAGGPIDPDGGGPLTRTLTTTDANGYYRFDNLPAGEYTVRVTAPAGYVSSTADEATGDADVDGGPGAASDNGIGTANTATSGVITLGAAEPTGETDLVGGANPQGGPDNRGNMTVDFGFRLPGGAPAVNPLPAPTIPVGSVITAAPVTTPPAPVTTAAPAAPAAPATTAAPTAPLTQPTLAPAPGTPPGSVGGTVFIDRNRNGVRDPNEPVVPSAVVNLRTPDGRVLEAQTDASGAFRFTQLTPGAYVASVEATKPPTNGPAERTITLTDAQPVGPATDFGFGSATDVMNAAIVEPIAFTGSPARTMTLLALVALSVGSLLVLVSRRRRTV